MTSALTLDPALKVILADTHQGAIDAIFHYYPDADPETYVIIFSGPGALPAFEFPNTTPWCIATSEYDHGKAAQLRAFLGPPLRVDQCCNAVNTGTAINPKLLDR